MKEPEKTEPTAQAQVQEQRSGDVHPVTVLHVDDDPNDTALLQAASRKAAVSFDLQNVEDGDEAMAYLSGTGNYTDRERYRVPALVLLDLKMPRANGFEILKWIRHQPKLKQLPVIVLSGSELQEDIRLGLRRRRQFLSGQTARI